MKLETECFDSAETDETFELSCERHLLALDALSVSFKKYDISGPLMSSNLRWATSIVMPLGPNFFCFHPLHTANHSLASLSLSAFAVNGDYR